MLITKSRLMSLPNVAALLDAAKNRFSTVTTPGANDATDDTSAEAPSPDQISYQSLLNDELDRDAYTVTEREDSDMLNQVRAALYDD